MSGYSSAKSTKSTNPATVKLPDGTTTPMYDQPTSFKATDTDHEHQLVLEGTAGL